MYTCTHNVYTHTRTHTRKHKRTHTRMHTQTYTHARTQIQTYTHTHICTTHNVVVVIITFVLFVQLWEVPMLDRLLWKRRRLCKHSSTVCWCAAVTLGSFCALLCSCAVTLCPTVIVIIVAIVTSITITRTAAWAVAWSFGCRHLLAMRAHVPWRWWRWRRRRWRRRRWRRNALSLWRRIFDSLGVCIRFVVIETASLRIKLCNNL